MNSVLATIRDGVIVPQQPIPWPEGAAVEVRLANDVAEEWGMTEEEQSGSPEAIARWQAEFAAIPVATWTDADQEAWDRRRREDKEWEVGASKGTRTET